MLLLSHCIGLQETKMVFEKLYKFIGKDIKSMIERPDGRYCLRLHKNKVFYVSEALMKKATNVSSSQCSSQA
jgi:60S ribosome subunit biogenesis protein NIP7